MEILLAAHAGFCFGVRRATQMAFDAAEKCEETFSLGPIIHSPQVVSKLEEMGTHIIDDLSEMGSGTIIIRSHGVTASEIAEAESRGLDIVDATCPYVKKAQDHVRDLSAEGYDVVVVGDKEHPEVQGIVSYATGKVYVVSSKDDAEKLPRMARIGVVAQTTQSHRTFEDVVLKCLKLGNEIRVYRTICDATTVRQESAKELAQQVDCVIVTGGFNSGNTRRLAEVCSEIQPRTFHIETARELLPDWFEGVSRVGVTAGASTPKWIIDEVIKRIEQIDKDKNG